MPGQIPDARFRLPETFLIQPELGIDEGPSRGLLVGQNAAGSEFEAIFLGKHAESGHKGVWIDVRGAHAVYVMGKRRSGKSFTLGALAEGLVSDTWVRQGGTKQAVLILDTMNVFLTMPFGLADTLPDSSPQLKEAKKWGLVPEQPKVCLYAPLGAQLPSELKCTPITLRASDLEVDEWCSLFDVDQFTDPMGHLIATLISELSETGYETAAGEVIASKAYYGLTELVAALDTSVAAMAFADDTRAALRRRFAAIERMDMFGPAGLDVRSLLVPGVISVLLLRDLDQDMRSVMVALIVKQMMRARATAEQQERMVPVHLARAEKYQSSDPTRAAEEQRLAQECIQTSKNGLPRSWLIIDEAHNYIPARAAPPSRKPLKKYVDEGRNLGLSIVVATQQPSGLDPSIQRNADILLIHSLSHNDDIAAAQGMINSAEPDEIVVDGKIRISGSRVFERMVRALALGYALVSTDRASRLFPIRVRPRSTVHGGSDY